MENNEKYWNPNKPISHLPPNLEKLFMSCSSIMLNDLNSRPSKIELVPAPDAKFEGHMIKITHNPIWYIDYYWEIPKKKNRKLTLDSLEKISNGQDRELIGNSGIYDSRLREIIYSLLITGDEELRIKKHYSIQEYGINDWD